MTNYIFFFLFSFLQHLLGLASEHRRSIIVTLRVANVAPAFAPVTNDVTTRRDVEEIPFYAAQTVINLKLSGEYIIVE